MKLKRILRIEILVIFSVLGYLCSCNKGDVPTIETLEPSGLTDNSAFCGGNILSNGGAPLTEKGLCWKKDGEPTIADNIVRNTEDSLKFTSLITDLESGSSYGVRAYARNKAGIGYGDPVYFTTYPRVPFISGVSISSLTVNSVTLTGYFIFGSGLKVFSTGICYSRSPHPDISNSFVPTNVVSDTVKINLNELFGNTVYYVRLCVLLRLYGTTNYYAVYGNETSFRTKIIPVTPTIKDIMGNVYSTIQFGNQVWLRENLRVSALNDGIVIQNVTGSSTWNSLSTPGYCWYNNAPDTIYGVLYNWYTVKTGRLCPSGWHVPSYSDWLSLISYFGSLGNWEVPKNFIDKQTGFWALPGGYRNNGSFQGRGSNGYWWSSTDTPTQGSRTILVSSEGFSSFNLTYSRQGLSVRCIKD